MEWNELLQIIYDNSQAYLIRKFDQRTLTGDHNASGLCLGLSFNWFVQKLQNVATPMPQLNMKRVYFAQALGNLQAWAQKGHLPTGRAFSDITMRDLVQSSPFNEVRKHVVPDRSYQPESQLYEKSGYVHDIGKARQDLGAMNQEWYGEHVLGAALQRYRSKLKDSSKHYGYLTPLLPGGVACVGRREGFFGSAGWRGFTQQELEQRLTHRLVNSLDPHQCIRGAFMTLYKSYLADCADVCRLRGIDPMSATVCAVIGWLAGKDGGAHAVALSYRGDALGEVGFFDPNMGDFAFSSWTEFRTWHSVVFPAAYGHRKYARWDLELYTRPFA